MPSRPSVEELYHSLGRTMARFYGAVPGSRCDARPGGVLGCSGLAGVFLNAGIVFGDEAEGGAEQTLRDYVAVIRELGTGGYVCVSERLGAALAPAVAGLGLERLQTVPLMVRPPDPPPAEPPGAPAGLACARVRDAAGIAELLAVSDDAFGLPPGLYAQVVTPALLDEPSLALYVCRRGGRAVSCACVADEDGLVNVSGMATLVAEQGRGAGGVLFRHLLRAHAPGARALCLTASEAGRRLYEAGGFRIEDEATAWLVPPA